MSPGLLTDAPRESLRRGVALNLFVLGLVTLAVFCKVVVVGGSIILSLNQRVSGTAHRGPTHTGWSALDGLLSCWDCNRQKHTPVHAVAAAG